MWPSPLESLLQFSDLTLMICIQASKLYPPRSTQDLKNLHGLIVSSESPDHHKQSVLYYMLKDGSHSNGQAAQNFAQVSYLPENYKIFIDGIWYLDRLKFEVHPAHVILSWVHTDTLSCKNALEYLTEPGLIPTYPDEILYALCRHAPENDSSLPLAYYHTVLPSIASSKVLEAFFFILCRSSITEAFFFLREQGESIHHDLFEKLIDFVLVHSSGGIRAKRGIELISLPLDDAENDCFEKYLKEGKGRTLPGASDTIIMRELAKGDSNFLLQSGKKVAGRKVAGVNWATLQESLSHDSRLKS